MRRDKVIQSVLRDEGISVSEATIHRAYHMVEPVWLQGYGSRVLKGADADAAFEELDALVLREAKAVQDKRRSDELALLIRRRWAEVDKIIRPEMYEESVPLLRKLKSAGLRLGLISNAPPETKRTVLELGLDKYLDPLVISGIFGYAKPSPEIFQHAMKLASEALRSRCTSVTSTTPMSWAHGTQACSPFLLTGTITCPMQTVPG